MSRDFGGTVLSTAARQVVAVPTNKEKRDRSPVSRRPSNYYDVKVNLNGFDIDEISALSIKKRFSKLYIPSDFFKGSLNFQKSYPITDPIKLGYETNFHIFDKSVDRINLTDGSAINKSDDSLTIIEPSDVSYRFSAKVILLSTPSLCDLYNNALRMADEELGNLADKKHLFDQVKFVVGCKSATEIMAIGGPWSASLDGENPSGDPQVLINTAIRTCKGLTGIDLSKCTKWLRFVEYNYIRSADRVTAKSSSSVNPTATTPINIPEGTSTTTTSALEGEGSNISVTSQQPSIESVVYFIPDVHQCMPANGEEWNKICDFYSDYIEEKLNPKPKTSTTTMTSGEGGDNSGQQTVISEPTHYSRLIPASMKVIELRQELDARSLDSKGIKSVITARLEQALQEERSNDPNPPSSSQDATEVSVTKSDIECKPPSALTPEEKESLEKLYHLDKVRESNTEEDKEGKPSIVVHPSSTSRGGKFDCKVVTLNQLLSYSGGGTLKEHTFEIHLVGELFHEMLLRDAAFQIYRSLTQLPKRPHCSKGDIKRFRRTVDVDTLLALSLYEKNDVDYIRDVDLEDIVLSLNLGVSRSHLRNLYRKGDVRKDYFYYRCLTDFDVEAGSEEDITRLKRSRALGQEEAEGLLREGVIEVEEIKKVGDTKISVPLAEKLAVNYEENALAQYQVREMELELERTQTLLMVTKESEERLTQERVRLQKELEEESVLCDDVKAVNVSYKQLLGESVKHLGKAYGPIQERFDVEKAEREAIERAKKEAEEEAERKRLQQEEEEAEAQRRALQEKKEEEEAARKRQEEAESAVAMEKDEEVLISQEMDVAEDVE